MSAPINHESDKQGAFPPGVKSILGVLTRYYSHLAFWDLAPFVVYGDNPPPQSRLTREEIRRSKSIIHDLVTSGLLHELKVKVVTPVENADEPSMPVLRWRRGSAPKELADKPEELREDLIRYALAMPAFFRRDNIVVGAFSRDDIARAAETFAKRLPVNPKVETVNVYIAPLGALSRLCPETATAGSGPTWWEQQATNRGLPEHPAIAALREEAAALEGGAISPTDARRHLNGSFTATRLQIARRILRIEAEEEQPWGEVFLNPKGERFDPQGILDSPNGLIAVYYGGCMNEVEIRDLHKHFTEKLTGFWGYEIW